MTRSWAPQTRYTLQRNTASTMEGLVLEVLTRNNEGRGQKNFQERAIENKDRTIAHQDTSLLLLAVED